MARSTFKVLFYVNGSKEKNGIVPIMGRVTINGSVAQFSCKQTIPKTLWDAKGNRAKGKSTEARNINLALDNIKAQIIKHYQRISDREAYMSRQKWSATPIKESAANMKRCSERLTRITPLFKSVWVQTGSKVIWQGFGRETMWQPSSRRITNAVTVRCQIKVHNWALN